MSMTSMFEEKKELIAEKLTAGASVKEIWNELGPDWYCYRSLYSYIRKNFGKVGGKKRINCEMCSKLVFMKSPYKSGELPVCPARNRVFKRDLRDCPYRCDDFEKKQEGGPQVCQK